MEYSINEISARIRFGGYRPLSPDIYSTAITLAFKILSLDVNIEKWKVRSRPDADPRHLNRFDLLCKQLRYEYERRGMNICQFQTSG